ncbi:RuvB-like protein 1, partial [Tanacetum coccineum]
AFTIDLSLLHRALRSIVTIYTEFAGSLSDAGGYKSAVIQDVPISKPLSWADVLELQAILAIREQVEELSIDEESLAYLREIGQQASLRFVFYHATSNVVQLLMPRSVVAKMNGRQTICKADLEEVSSLYLNAKSFSKLLQEQQDRYIS